MHILPSSLTNRVFALYATTLLLLVVGGLALFLRYQFHQQVEETERSAVMLVEVVAQSVQDSVVVGDFDAVRKILSRGVQGSEFATASFIALDGGVVGAHNRTQAATQAPDWLTRKVELALDDVNRNVSVGGKDYGILRLQFDAHYLAGSLWAATWMAIVGAMTCLVVGLVLIRWALTNWLGGLVRLREAVEALGAGPTHTQTLVIANAPAEIQSLVDMVNQTASLLAEREVTQRTLTQRTEQLQVTLDNISQGVAMVAADSTIVFQSQRTWELLELPVSLQGARADEIIAFQAARGDFGKDYEAVDEAARANLRAGGRGDIPAPPFFTRRTPSGRTLEIKTSPLPDGGWVRTYTDVTGYVEALAQAKQASIAKGQFLANMSHEIRTPMNAILGLLKLMQDTPLDATQLDFVTKTEGAAKSLLSLLNDILDFSKVEAGKMTLDPRPFNLDAMLENLAVILRPTIGSKPVVLRFDVEAAVPRNVVGDDMRLQQVLINLGGNAVKFTSEGEVSIRVRLVERRQDDVQLEFAVCDNGIGIAPENQARIFDGFSQAEASTTRRFGGTGLGLTISSRLVILLGGELKINSVVGQGSTFSFQLRLPIAKQTSPPAAVGTAHPSASGGPKRLQGMRLLVVEDNKINQMVAQGLLSKEGAQVTLADDGQLGVAAVAAAQPQFDAVLMDVQMPVMDGYAASRAIRQDLGLKTLPIIAMTANAMASDRADCLAAGMDDHIGKPFELDHLVATLLRLAAQP